MFTLFRHSFKTNIKIVLAIMAILTLYFTIIANMYDPNSLDVVEALAQMKLSPELLQAFGFVLTDTSLTGFLSSYFYGMLMLAFPMLIYTTISNKLVASMIDKGSMANILATPYKRINIILTQLLVLIIDITLVISYVSILGLVFCEIKFSGMLDIKAWLLINLGVLLLHLAIGSISFLSSCIFNDSRISLMFGAGIPVLFLVMNMLKNAAVDYTWLQYTTLMTLYNPNDIMANNDITMPFIMMGIIAVIFYSAGCIIFTKKDIPV